MRIGLGGGNRLLRGGFSVGRGGLRGGVGVGPISVTGGGGGRRSSGSTGGGSDDGLGALVGLCLIFIFIGVVYVGAYALARVTLPIVGFLVPITSFALLLRIGDYVNRRWFDNASYFLWGLIQVAVFVGWTSIIGFADSNAVKIQENPTGEDISRLGEAAWYSVGDGANIARWSSLVVSIFLLSIWTWAFLSDRFGDSLGRLADRMDDLADRIDGGP